jgi:hypothetical protein
MSYRRTLKLRRTSDGEEVVSAFEALVAALGQGPDEAKDALRTLFRKKTSASRQKTAAQLLHREIDDDDIVAVSIKTVQGTSDRKWVVNYDELMALIEIVPQNGYIPCIREFRNWREARLDAGDQTIKDVVDENATDQGALHRMARRALGISEAIHVPVGSAEVGIDNHDSADDRALKRRRLDLEAQKEELRFFKEKAEAELDIYKKKTAAELETHKAALDIKMQGLAGVSQFLQLSNITVTDSGLPSLCNIITAIINPCPAAAPPPSTGQLQLSLGTDKPPTLTVRAFLVSRKKSYATDPDTWKKVGKKVGQLVSVAYRHVFHRAPTTKKREFNGETQFVNVFDDLKDIPILEKGTDAFERKLDCTQFAAELKGSAWVKDMRAANGLPTE